MKSILYLQHVGWGWIKQRPHFIAEYLSKRCNVDVFTERSYHDHWSAKNSDDLNIRISTLNGLPLRRFRFIRSINRVLIEHQLASIVGKYDIVWVTHPSLFPYIKNILSHSVQVVYDCMDDALAFPLLQRDSKLMKVMYRNETELLERANYIFVSSKNLESKVKERGASSPKIKIINNAISQNLNKRSNDLVIELPQVIEEIFAKPGFRLIYVGTISEWFDFSLVLEGLDRFPHTRCFLIGPTEVCIPKHERLHHLGPVEHNLVMPILSLADILIMPFILNELVLSVDPVKLYEYIASGRTILSIGYLETEKFQSYVHLYHDSYEYFDIIKKYTQGELPALAAVNDISQYLAKNDWASRCDEIASLIGL